MADTTNVAKDLSAEAGRDTSDTRGTAGIGTTDLRDKVRERYGKSALQVSAGGASCCGGEGDSSCCSNDSNPITGNLYSLDESSDVPVEALLASLGCGNPTALARLNPGETVLDLGSGGGIDVLLSAKRVGPTGFAYGLDMTDEMLALAEENKRKAGVENVQFLKGYIESIPLPDNSVDVIISNCVINLAADKAPVLKEAFRVLKPGGRFAVSDVVRRGEAPQWILRSFPAWSGCIAGALHEEEYKTLLTEAGFTDVGVEVTRSYSAKDIVNESGTNLSSSDAGTSSSSNSSSCCTPAGLMEVAKSPAAGVFDGLFVSAFVRATKPQA